MIRTQPSGRLCLWQCFNSNRLPHGGGKRARVLAGDNEVVEEGENEVEDQASPDRDVVEHCPVGSVKGDLEQMFTPLLSI